MSPRDREDDIIAYHNFFFLKNICWHSFETTLIWRWTEIGTHLNDQTSYYEYQQPISDKSR